MFRIDNRVMNCATAVVFVLFVVASQATGLGGLKSRIVERKPPQAIKPYDVFATPYISPAFNEEPVFVSAVTTNADDQVRGWTLSEVQITNRAKPVRSLSLGYFISPQESPGKVMQSYSTPEFFAKHDWALNEPWDIEFGLVTHRDLVTLSTKEENSFQVDVAVMRVVFEDGDVWERPATKQLAYLVEKQGGDGADATRACTHTRCNYHYGGSCVPPCYDMATGTCGCSCAPSYYFCEPNGTAPTKCKLGTCNQSCQTLTCTNP